MSERSGIGKRADAGYQRAADYLTFDYRAALCRTIRVLAINTVGAFPRVDI